MKKKVWKKIAFICSYMMLALLCGCNMATIEEKNETKSIKIGVSIYDEYEPYLIKMSEGLNYWARQIEQTMGVKIYMDVVYAAGSQLTQNDQIEEFADRGYDVVCVNLVDRTDATVIIEKAKSVNMPVIFFNRELVKEDLQRWDKLYYVGGNAGQAGIFQGEIIADELKKNFEKIDKNNDGILQYVMLEGQAGHQDALVRTDMSVSTVSEMGYELQKIGDERANWSKAQAKTKLSALLSKTDEEIEIVFANDDDMALGAIDALKEVMDKKELPLVVGVNGMEEALNKVKVCEMTGTVYNNWKEQTRIIAQMAYYLGIKKDFPKEIPLTGEKYVYVPYEKITYENVQEYIVNFNKY